MTTTCSPIPKVKKLPKKPSLHVLDSEFSRFIRSRDEFTCQRCDKVYLPNAMGLHNSHFIGRANRATRWDPENCDAMCNGCHQYLETHKPTYYRDWKRNQLGEERFRALELRSREVKKWTIHELQELRKSWK